MCIEANIKKNMELPVDGIVLVSKSEMWLKLLVSLDHSYIKKMFFEYI